MLRRKRLPEELIEPYRAFARVVNHIEEGKVAITQAMPTTRSAGRPLAEALADYEGSLQAAAVTMPAWRTAATEGVWLRCEEGLREGSDRARRLREGAPDIAGFEGLIGFASTLIAVLEPFAEAEERFRTLRTSQN